MVRLSLYAHNLHPSCCNIFHYLLILPFPPPESLKYPAICAHIFATDIYIACVSSAHNVCPKGYWIAIVSTIAETTANHHLELQPGLERLGKIEEQFMVRARLFSHDEQISSTYLSLSHHMKNKGLTWGTCLS